MGLKSFLFGKTVCEMVDEVEAQREYELEERKPPSLVAHPPHYNTGKIEVIEAIEDWGLDKNYHRGNAIKYLARAGKKDPKKEIEDLEKGAWYLNREIELLKSKKEDRDPLRPNDMVKR